MKKKLFILLAVMLFMVHAQAWADQFEYGGLRYETGGVDLLVGQATCSVVGLASDNQNATYISIPADFAIDPQTGVPYWPIRIANNAFKDTKVNTIGSLGTIQEIGDYAFYNTRIIGDLTSITVMKVGDYAFYSCNLLNSVNFPACTEIGNSAFNGCGLLFNVTCPLILKIGDYAFYNCVELLHFELGPALQSLGRYAFANCVDMNDVINLGSVPLKTIPYACFQNCEDLKGIHFPSHLTNIGDYAFDGCLSLEEISIPDDVTEIGAFAFQNCRDLRQVYINGCNVRLSVQAPFKGCQNIKKVRWCRTEETEPFCNLFPDCKESLETVEYKSGSTCVSKAYPYGQYHAEFNGYTKLSTVALPDGITTIGTMAFYNCPALKQISLPGTVTHILGSAFEGSGIEELVIPTNVTTIGQSAFKNCSNLRSIVWNNQITSLPWYVCQGCSKLQTVDLPASITSIGRYAFEGCSAVEEVIIRGRQTSWESDYFTNCPNIKSLSLVSDWITPRLNTLVYSSKNVLEVVRLLSGSTCIGTTGSLSNGSRVHSYSTLEGFGKLRKVTIPEGVRMIGTQAFQGDTLLTEINLPSSVDTIGDYAFRNTSIKKIVIPKKVSFIPNRAFSNCAHLSEVQFTNNLQKIGEYAFEKCVTLTEISLPFSVTEIGNGAFSGCSAVTSITIGDKVTKLGDRAFENCTEVTDVICYVKEPLSISGWEYSPFAGIDKEYAYLYVPATGVDAYKEAIGWKEFTHILPIGADFVQTNGVQIVATETTATISWPETDGADFYYLLIVDQNSNKVCEFYFDYLGDLMDASYATEPSAVKPKAPQRKQADGFSWVVNGLASGSTYAYAIQAGELQSAQGSILNTLTGTFSTKELDEAVEYVNAEGVTSCKIVRDGQIYILRGEKIYTVTGAGVK